MKFTPNVTQNGLYGGISVVILLFAYYFINAKMLYHPGWSLLPYVTIFPLFMTLAALADRKENGNHITLLEAFKSAFFTGAISLFIMFVFLYLLQTVIDPSVIKVAKEASLESSIAIAEFFSGGELPEESMDEIVKQINEADYSPKPLQTLIGYVIFAVLGAIPALIIGAIVQRKEDLIGQSE